MGNCTSKKKPRLTDVEYKDTVPFVPPVTGGRVVKVYDGDTITIEAATGLPTAVPITADAEGYYPAEGEGSVLVSILDGTALGSDTAIQVTTDGVSVASLNPSAGACRNSPSAILVEVCYYRPAPAPDAEDAHIPYAVEAGQGT